MQTMHALSSSSTLAAPICILLYYLQQVPVDPTIRSTHRGLNPDAVTCSQLVLRFLSELSSSMYL